MAATDHQVDSAICGAFTLLWGEKTALWPQTFNTALNKLGGSGVGGGKGPRPGAVLPNENPVAAPLCPLWPGQG